jgi:hypothetical protein
MSYIMAMRESSGFTGYKQVSVPSMLAGLVLAVLAVILITTCNLPLTFGDEYRDSTINFIADRVLAAPPPATDDGSTVPLDALAVWDWGWRGQTGTGNDFEYMDMTAAGIVGSNVTSGSFTLASSAESWELELVNLSGDPFSEGGSIHAGWVAVAPGTIAQGAAIPASHGKFVFLSSIGPDWSGFDPNTAGFLIDDPVMYPGNTYQLSAFSLDSTIRYVIGDSTSPDFNNSKFSNLTNGKHVFDIFSVDANTRFMVGDPNAVVSQNIDLDDIRFIRADIKEQLRLRIRLAPQDVTPSLVAGKYEFSIWIKAPLLSLAYDDPARTTGGSVNAQFASSEVTLEIRQVRFLEATSTPRLFQQTFPVTATWTRVALRMEDGNLDRFDETTAEAVIELSIYPFNPQDPEVGAVMIADPRLRFFIDGYTN